MSQRFIIMVFSFDTANLQLEQKVIDGIYEALAHVIPVFEDEAGVDLEELAQEMAESALEKLNDIQSTY